MSMNEFLIVWAACLVTMLACRCIPIFILKGKDLPESLQSALRLIPTAAFAALVANDLFSAALFEQGISAGVVGFVSAGIVVVVAKTTKSLIWCAVTGVLAYALLSMAL